MRVSRSGPCEPAPGTRNLRKDIRSAGDPTMSDPLILASRSPARAALLRAAGIDVEVVPAAVDEAAVKAALLDEQAPARDIADALAELKALRIGRRSPGRLVLGADQVLVCDGRIYDKPAGPDEAAEHLRALRGRTHELYSAAVICDGPEPIWRHVGRVQMTMRPFSDAFLDSYLRQMGDGFVELLRLFLDTAQERRKRDLAVSH